MCVYLVLCNAITHVDLGDHHRSQDKEQLQSQGSLVYHSLYPRPSPILSLQHFPTKFLSLEFLLHPMPILTRVLVDNSCRRGPTTKITVFSGRTLMILLWRMSGRLSGSKQKKNRIITQNWTCVKKVGGTNRTYKTSAPMRTLPLWPSRGHHF